SEEREEEQPRRKQNILFHRNQRAFYKSVGKESDRTLQGKTSFPNTEDIRHFWSDDNNVNTKEAEKARKYKDLEIEISRMWKTKTRTVPVIIGALGTATMSFKNNIKELPGDLSRAKCLLESQSNLSNNIPHNNDDHNDDTKSQQSESDTQSISEQSVYTQGQATHVIQSQNDGFKLPDVDLPKFNGEYESWMEFRETFESMIHMNTQLHNIRKFHYLRASLAGDANRVIQEIEFTADNYSIAWQVLRDRYDNKQVLIQNHLRAICNFEGFSTASSAKIREVSENLFKHLKSLKQLGISIEKWDVLVIYLTVSKLDRYSSQEWERHTANTDIPTLVEFKDFLRKRATLLEKLEMDYVSKVSVTQVDEINDTHNESNEVKVGATQCTLVAAQNALLATAQVDVTVTDPLQNQLRKFWELEEIPFDSPAWSPEERLCEKHFIENLQVLENGRFMASLPFKESPDKLGHSRE
ncbi:unnamed protein product, partial [Acanthoscelides obtectus]